MSEKLFTLPRVLVFDTNAALVSGAKANFYIAGTLTRQNTFTDSALTVASSNPVVADGNGVLAPIYLDATLNYKVDITDSLDSSLSGYPVDNITAALTAAEVGAVLYPITVGETSAGLTTADLNISYKPLDINRYGTNTTPGTTDMTTAISNATAAAGSTGWVEFQGETYAVSSLAFTNNMRWRCSSGQATIKCSNTGGVQEGFITVTGSLIVDLKGLIFDGNSKVDRLVEVINSSDTGSGKYVSSEGCTFKNTDTNTRSSAGLRVVGGFDFVYTDPTTVFRDLTATGTSKVARGLATASSGAFYVRNAITESFFDNITPVDDADGVFAEALTGTKNDSHLTVTAVARFRNCAKRAIKIQVYSASIGACHIERTLDHLNTGNPEISVQAGGAIIDGVKFEYALGDYAPQALVQFNNVLDADTPTSHRNPSKWINSIVNIGDSTPLDHGAQINCALPSTGNDDIEISNNTFNCLLTKLVSLDPNAGDAADVQIDGLLIDNNYIKELSGTNHALIWGSRLSGPGSAAEMRARVRNNVVGNSSDAPAYYNAEADTFFTTGSAVDFTPLEWINNVGVTVPKLSASVPATVNFTLFRDGTETATGTFTAAVDKLVTDIDSNGGAVTVTSPDGAFQGQRKVFTMSDASTSSTVSVTSHETSDPEVFTFAQTTDYLILEWSVSQAFWWTVKNIGVAT
ncbi:MAG TPA: hypothetical protein ENI05_12530 [Porticoccus sp.]|nr:hypothetical protein [Porticoccus sp.]